MELAPRDVVARAIVSEMTRTGYAACFSGPDPSRRELHPRALPADLRNLSAIRSEYRDATRPRWRRRRITRWAACGPIWTGARMWRGCSRRAKRPAPGVHGANRLASNSLLEGVVFGIRAGRAMREATGAGLPADAPPSEMRGRWCLSPNFAGGFSGSRGRNAGSCARGRAAGGPGAIGGAGAGVARGAQHAAGGVTDRALRAGARGKPRGALPHGLSGEVARLSRGTP